MMKRKIFSLMICIILLVGTISFISAINQETYDKMNFFTKIKYEFESGRIFGLFTTWGQANCCSVDPDKEKWIQAGDRIDCDDYCSYDKCALDIWYDNTLYLQCPPYCGPPSGDPNWDNWLKEISGEGAYFSATSSRPWYYVQVYCCPKECVTDDHSTRAYVCETGEWDYKGRYDKDEYCRHDTSGVDLCWCADPDDNFYVDESGAVHCRGSARSSWCTPYTAHYEKKCVGIGTTEYYYWYDSEGNRNDLIDTCSSSEKCSTMDGCVSEGEACTPHSTKKCYSNDVYWYDSCGVKEELYQDCGAAGCLNGACKTCNTEADTNCDGNVDRNELGVYIDKWVNNQITRTKFGEIIQAWSESPIQL